MVFYRKYRPQTIEELDSSEVRVRLTSVLEKDNVHALLFTGPKGLGKTSTARIIAKVINCEPLNEKRQLTINNSQLTKKEKISQLSKVNSEVLDLEPCNKCDSCISITKGINVDVLEIDAASNRGIDEIRDLREKIKLSPASARKKVYIIDEVHMLTTEAFNALLKTLEEPPDHVVFILCTTEPHKVPATIASRCFHIPFKKATDDELVRAFSRISKSEKISVDEEALYEIAKFSDGSFRDGVKALEEISTLSNGKKIDLDFVQSSFQTSGSDKSIDEMIAFLIKKDMKSGIKLVGELIQKGSDMKFFVDSLVSKLHTILLEKVGVSESKSKIGEGIELEELKNLIGKIAEASGKIKFSVLPQLPLEIAIIEWSTKEEDYPQIEIKNVKAASVAKTSDSIGLEDKNVKNSPNSDILVKLIDRVKLQNQSIAGFLRGCMIKDYKDTKLVLESKFEFHKEKLEKPEAIRIIEEVLKDLTEEEISVSFVLKS